MTGWVQCLYSEKDCGEVISWCSSCLFAIGFFESGSQCELEFASVGGRIGELE